MFVAHADVSLIVAHADVSLIMARHIGRLLSETDLATHESLVQMHIDELDRVSLHYAAAWNDDLELLRQAGKLQLFVSLLMRGFSTGKITGDTN